MRRFNSRNKWSRASMCADTGRGTRGCPKTPAPPGCAVIVPVVPKTGDGPARNITPGAVEAT